MGRDGSRLTRSRGTCLFVLVSNAICGVSGNTIKKGQSPAGGDQDDEPVAVARLFDGIESKLVRRDIAWKMVDWIALGRVGGIKLAPIGLRTVPDN